MTTQAFSFIPGAFADFFAQGRTALESALGTSRERFESAMKNASALTDLPPRAFQAVVAGSTAAVKGVEQINAEALAFGRARLDNGVDAAKKLAVAKSLQDAIALQTAYAQDEFKAFASYAKQIGSMSRKAAEDSVAPVTAEIKAMAESLTGKKAA